MRVLFLCWLMVIAFVSKAEDVELTRFEVKGDDFSNEKLYTVKAASYKPDTGVLFITCNESEQSIDIQMWSDGTIFPNESDSDRMYLSVTHKFLSDHEAETTTWHMNMMEYKNAFYAEDSLAFIDNAIESDGVNVRFNKRGQVFKFVFSETNKTEHLTKVREACSKQ